VADLWLEAAPPFGSPEVAPVNGRPGGQTASNDQRALFLPRSISKRGSWEIVRALAGPGMPLTLWDVQRDPIATRALEQLMDRYDVVEDKSGLILTQKAGEMKLFLNDLDDLHQWDFVQNQNMAKENEQLRALSQKLYQQRQSWKHRALVAEATLLEAETSHNGGRENVRDLRYAALKRYLAKQFHPDFAPGNGIEKIVRNEIFKEIWSEIDRLDHQAVSTTCSATARSSSTV